MVIEARPRLTLDDILVIDADVHAHEQPDQMLPYTDPPWREALANVAKYAQASTVGVRVTRLNGNAVVEVADDGVGGADPGSGTGLRGLADRVEALDGHLHVESSPGRGTVIRAEIPCG